MGVWSSLSFSKASALNCERRLFCRRGELHFLDLDDRDEWQSSGVMSGSHLAFLRSDPGRNELSSKKSMKVLSIGPVVMVILNESLCSVFISLSLELVSAFKGIQKMKRTFDWSTKAEKRKKTSSLWRYCPEELKIQRTVRIPIL